MADDKNAYIHFRQKNLKITDCLEGPVETNNKVVVLVTSVKGQGSSNSTREAVVCSY
jgi:hypothetical protein